MKVETLAVVTCSIAASISLGLSVVLIVCGPWINRCIGIWILVLTTSLAKLAWEIATGRRV